MARLEDLVPGVAVKGILPNASVNVVSTEWIGQETMTLTYKDSAGRLGDELIYRDRECEIEIDCTEKCFKFDGDGNLFKLTAEAYRIRIAHLFDPMMAVHTSLVEPLPHQIIAVYKVMLQRQPLRFLLADDPGAGKTIMAGLLIKEL